MDRGRDENAAFFSAIFRLIQTNAMIFLDHMRDPMGVLTILDYFALATIKDKDLDLSSI